MRSKADAKVRDIFLRRDQFLLALAVGFAAGAEGYATVGLGFGIVSGVAVLVIALAVLDVWNRL